MIISCAFPIIASGGSELVIEAVSQQAFAGDTVEIPIRINANPGVTVILIDVTYDSSVVTLVNATDLGNFGSNSHGDNFASNPYTLYWNNNLLTENKTVTGAVAVLKFKVNDNAAKGTTAISLATRTLGILNKDAIEVPASFVNATITIGEEFTRYTPADSFLFETDDVNGTAAITDYVGIFTDVVIAPEYEIGGNTYTVNAITGYTKSVGKNKVAYGAFANNTMIESVVIPATVEKIGDTDNQYYALYDCTSLKLVKIFGNPEIIEGSIGIVFDSGSETDVVSTECVICGWTGDAENVSLAQEYAKDNGVEFEGLEKIAYKGCQVSTGIKTEEKFNIRFAAVIGMLDYKEIGIDVSSSANGKSWSNKSTTVYKSLLGTSSDGKAITAVTAKELGGKYISAISIMGAPTNKEIVFQVRPYVINGLGVKVYGDIWNVTVNAEGEVSNVKQ